MTHGMADFCLLFFFIVYSTPVLPQWVDIYKTTKRDGKWHLTDAGSNLSSLSN